MKHNDETEQKNSPHETKSREEMNEFIINHIDNLDQKHRTEAFNIIAASLKKEDLIVKKSGIAVREDLLTDDMITYLYRYVQQRIKETNFSLTIVL